MISIVDYGIGNLASISNMLKKVGVESRLVSRAKDIEESSKLILPGVGAFDAGINKLRSRGFDQALLNAVDNGAYLLGICLGMQMLLDSSEEGSSGGLSLIKGRAKKFDGKSLNIRVPHMGWNIVNPVSNSLMFDPSIPEHRYYFVHSFYVQCDNSDHESAHAIYGKEFCCAIQKDRVLGVQFHPEKSHKFGMAMFSRYAELEC